jgi:ABC-type uncharacterized transport system permease subunit
MKLLFFTAKGLEALGIVCVLFGLLHGISSPTLWGELYLSVLGIVLFLIGRGLEKLHARKTAQQNPL